MRIALNLVAIVAVGFLAACGEEGCTNEEAMKKSTELTAKLQEMAATDPVKLAELAPKVQELATKASGTGDDLQAACKAMDEMMAELSK